MALEPRIIAILQARMGSVRLPGKVLAPLSGRPMLEHIVTRIQRTKRVTQIVVATTELSADDAVCSTASRLGVASYRGSENDVLDRYYRAASEYSADVIVRLTGDNPLVEGEFIDWCIEQFVLAHPPAEYLDTGTSQTFPFGLSVEVFGLSALKEAWKNSTEAEEREHVTPYIRRHKDRFRSIHLGNSEDDSDLRWTVDTTSDLQRMRELYKALELDKRAVPYRDIVSYMRANPQPGRVTTSIVQ